MPTLLERSPESLIQQIIRLSPYFPAFQIDVTDGVFAAGKTPSVADLIPFLDSIPGHIRGKIVFDYHLMTEDYGKQIGDIVTVSKQIQVRNILIHCDLSPNYYLLSKSFPQFTFGAVLNSEDNVNELIENYEIKTFSVIQLMTVHIGSQGNPFIIDVLTKIDQLKKTGFQGQIFLDGGINRETLPAILSRTYLPHVLCVGSFLTHSEHLPADAEFLFDSLRQKERE